MLTFVAVMLPAVVTAPISVFMLSVVVTASVSVAMTVIVSVVAAADLRVIVQVSCQIRLDCFIGISRCASIELYARFPKGCLSSTADPAADQHICTCLRKESTKSSVALAVRIDDLAVDDFAILHIVELELLCVAKVLEYLSVIVCNCDPHLIIRLSSYLLHTGTTCSGGSAALSAASVYFAALIIRKSRIAAL